MHSAIAKGNACQVARFYEPLALSCFGVSRLSCFEEEKKVSRLTTIVTIICFVSRLSYAFAPIFALKLKIQVIFDSPDIWFPE